VNLHLSGKVALVTAASRGLGRAIAMRLAHEGADVAICARGEVDLQRTAAEIRAQTAQHCLAVEADLTSQQTVQSLVQTTLDDLGSVDILITNAGGPPRGGFLDVSLQEWESATDLTLMSVVHLCHAVVPTMIERRQGSIPAITSISVKQPIPGLILSTSMRLGVVGLIKTLANELSPYNVRANAIAPGWTRADRVARLLDDRAKRSETTPEQEEQRIIREIPLGRMATPAEFAAAAVFLVSPAAPYITGVVLPVDGGACRGVL